MSIEVCSYLVDTNRQEECVYVVPHMRKQYVLCGIAGVSDKQFTIAFLSLTSVTKIAQKMKVAQASSYEECLISAKNSIPGKWETLSFPVMFWSRPARSGGSSVIV